MRQARRSVKDKIKDLKRVLDDGIQAINDTILEPITAMFVLPGNGREQPSDIVLEIDRDGCREITYKEYADRHGITLTTTTTEVVKTVIQSTMTEVAVTETVATVTVDPPKKRKERRSREPKGIEQVPAVEVKEPPAKKQGFDIDKFMENAIDADEIGKFNYKVGQRLIRPIRWY